MPRGKRPFASFQTKEEFDKAFHDTYREGYADGFNRGRIDGLAHVFVGIGNQFSDEVIHDASNAVLGIHIRQWERKHRPHEGEQKPDTTKSCEPPSDSH